MTTRFKLLCFLKKFVESIEYKLSDRPDIIAGILSSNNFGTILKNMTELFKIMKDNKKGIFTRKEIGDCTYPLFSGNMPNVSLLTIGQSYLLKASIAEKEDSERLIRYCTTISDLLLSAMALYSTLNNYIPPLPDHDYPEFILLMLKNVDIMWCNDNDRVKKGMELIWAKEKFLTKGCPKKYRSGTYEDTKFYRKYVALFENKIEKTKKAVADAAQADATQAVADAANGCELRANDSAGGKK